MYVYLYAAAFSDRLDVRQFVLWMRFNRHGLLMSVEGRSILTVRSGWLRRWMPLGGRDAALLHCHGRETK